MSVDLLLTGVIQGLVLSLIACGVMIPFRILLLPDLSAEGAYPLAGAVCAKCLLAGCNPWIAMILTVFSAGIFGLFTSWIHLRLKIDSLLSGIISSTMAYSVILRIIGKPNVALFTNHLLFDHLSKMKTIGMLGLLVICCIIPWILFLRTEVGLRLRAVGLNPTFATRQGIHVKKYIYLGFFIASCYTGLAGALIVQWQQYMDVGMGVGIVIHALAGLMLGEQLIGHERSLMRQCIAPLFGALIYQQIQGFALDIGLAPTDIQLLTGAMVLAIVFLQNQDFILQKYTLIGSRSS